MADGGLPFQEAIDFQRRKVNLPTERWDDLLRQAHVRAFSVAGATRDDMLADFRAAIDRARAEGTGFEEFRKSFDDIVNRTGWEFYAQGETEEARRNWRARVIYNTNMRTSYMAGRYRQMTDPDVLKYRPYWRYRHNYSRHPRSLHVAMNGKVWKANDDIWKIIYPPNGWGCNCDVEALNERQFRATGKSGPDPHPDLKPSLVKDPRTGLPETVYDGIDRGWDYNVGLEAQDGPVPPELQAPLRPAPKPSEIQVDAARAEPEGADASAPVPPQRPAGPDKSQPAKSQPEPTLPDPLPPMPPARSVPESRILPKGLPDEDYIDAFLEEFGASRDQGVVYRDKSGGVITISPDLFRERNATGESTGLKVSKNGREQFVKVMADAIIDPDEIWIDWVVHSATGRTLLRRSYLRLVTIGKQSIFVRYEWTSQGWIGVTAFHVTATYLNRARTGALLYRRKV